MNIKNVTEQYQKRWLCKKCKNILSSNKNNCEIASKKLATQVEKYQNNRNVHINIPNENKV